ncbi:MAG TPA: HNH endonuclease signature motif containing protein [Candidatus Paceibacterota bacterium]|nr:HNH endonuclease signature motif containing protein [Candidatus Paceibacterota bacterium]
MPSNYKKAAVIALASAFVGASYLFMPGAAPAPALIAVDMPALVREVASGTPALGKPSKATGCAVNGPLPDPLCSPGAIFARTPLETICQPGYTKKVRSVSTSLKKKIYAAYGIPYPQKTGTYELDHIVPLELGGSNEAANLYPEARDPSPGFREKDVVENYLHQEACAGRVALSDAQRAIAADWARIYAAMSPADIQAMRDLYKSWAD